MRYLPFLALFLAATVPGLAQKVNGPRTALPAKEPATISGVVIDYAGAVLPHVAVEAKSGKGKRYAAETNDDGVYTLTLPAGRYRVSFISSFGSFSPLTITDYPLPAYAKLHLDVSLACDDPCRSRIVY